jgi:hypothetical protein
MLFLAARPTHPQNRYHDLRVGPSQSVMTGISKRSALSAVDGHRTDTDIKALLARGDRSVLILAHFFAMLLLQPPSCRVTDEKEKQADGADQAAHRYDGQCFKERHHYLPQVCSAIQRSITSLRNRQSLPIRKLGIVPFLLSL